MWDSEPNSSIEELEEVTAEELDWSSAQQPASRLGRRSRQAAVAGNVECLVCRLPASGNNFGVATCESCKTFFRRNAKRDTSQVRCLHYSNCNVVKEYRRSCTACRLRKCFAVGMRKELILSDDKLRTRARPTFKKPRYRWCRVPASVDIGDLLAGLPSHQSQQVRVKEEAADPQEDGGPLTADVSQLSSATPSEADLSPAASVQFEASQVYSRLTACVTDYQLPYDNKAASSLFAKIFHLEDGFTTMDNPIRKMIRMIPELPHFDQLVKSLLGRIIKQKVFGALQITSVLNYDQARDAWIFPMEEGGGGQPSPGAEAVVPAREGMYGTFMSLTKRRLLDGRPLCTVSDVERMYRTLTGFYHEMQRLFGERRKLAAAVLLALYLLQDDVPLALSEPEKCTVRQIQWHYLGYLDDLVAMCELDHSRASYASKKTLLLLVQIRWLDTCYADAAKVLQLARVPPLMQELVTD